LLPILISVSITIFVLNAAPAYNSGFAPPLDSWCAVIKVYLKRQRKAAKRQTVQKPTLIV